MTYKFLKIILNLHDGDGAGAAPTGADGGDNSGATSTSTEIRSEVRAKGKSLGLSDDLMQDFQAAVDSRKGNKQTKIESESAEQHNNAEKFEQLIKGEYKNEFNQRVETAVGDRFAKKDKQIAELQSNAQIDNQIIAFIANKYPDVDPSDKQALLNAVTADNDLFMHSAIESGITAEEAKNKFIEQRKTDADKVELEQLRSEKAARELDAHLRSLAVQTQKLHPEFDLEQEFVNPDFRAAFEFIADQNAAENKRTGKSNEIYDLTKAYEMAHWDKIKNDVINRAGSAALSAATQNIVANGARFIENAATKGNEKPTPKSVSEMSDAEFSSLYDNVLSGKARIPR